MKLKSILFIFCFVVCVNANAQVTDSSQNNSVNLPKEKLFQTSFNGATNLLLPVGTFNKIGGSWGVGERAGFNFYIKRIHIGLAATTDFNFLEFDAEHLHAFFRRRFDDLKNYSDLNEERKIFILRWNLGLFYKQSFTVNSDIEFYLMGGKSYLVPKVWTGDDGIHTRYVIKDTSGSRIDCSGNPKFNGISYTFSIRAVKKMTNRISVGLNVNYVYEVSDVEIIESEDNFITHKVSKSYQDDKFSFSYLQLGICFRCNFFSSPYPQTTRERPQTSKKMKYKTPKD